MIPIVGSPAASDVGDPGRGRSGKALGFAHPSATIRGTGGTRPPVTRTEVPHVGKGDNSQKKEKKKPKKDTKAPPVKAPPPKK